MHGSLPIPGGRCLERANVLAVAMIAVRAGLTDWRVLIADEGCRIDEADDSQ